MTTWPIFRSLLRNKELKDPETLMARIKQEKERKIALRLEKMLEDFREQLEVQRKKLKEDYVGSRIFSIAPV